MQQAGDGKYCTRCSNVVYDLSGMNDDELFVFFKMNPGVHCGRFHNSQLARPILPPKKKQLFSFERFRKVAATFFAILSFKAGDLKAESNRAKPSLVFDSNFKKLNINTGDKITITGIVKDASGAPLEAVYVRFDSAWAAATGKDGKFSFEIDNVTGVNHILSFNLDGFITAVRSYHIVMQSTDYNVKLNKQGTGEGFYTSGIIALPSSDVCGLSEIVFKPNVSVLTGGNKTILDKISVKLKEHPEALIDIKATSISLGKNQALTKKRAEVIKKYLVDRQGIGSERIAIRMLWLGGDTNIIDIVDRYQ